METFSQMAQDWAGFFSALAQVSGGLVGLVFVALTFNVRALGVGGDPLLGALARQTFGDFVILLLVSLLMLVPHTSGANVGVILLGFGAIDAIRLGRTLIRLRRHLRGPSATWEVLQRFLLSGMAHLMLAVAGIGLIRGSSNSDLIGSLLFSGVILMLLSGCRSAWLLAIQEVRQ
ncbi:MAG: hypothetical protein OSA97_16760 [Nevskia sp.]|nr:hypothetical protein [Nevskia sp.]